MNNSNTVYLYQGQGASFPHRVKNDSGSHPASNPMGTGGLNPGVKRPVRESDH